MKAVAESEKGKLQVAIRKNDRIQVAALLKEKLLEEMDTEEREDIIRDAVSLWSMDIIEILAKRLPQFTPQMFVANIRNSHYRLCMNQMLNKYIKKFDLKCDEVQEWLMKTACQIGNKRTVKLLLHKEIKEQDIVWLSDAPETVFKMLADFKWDMIEPDVIIEILIRAARTEDGAYRLALLRESECPFDVAGSDGRTAEEVLLAKLRKKPKDKREIWEQGRTRRALKSIQEIQNRKRSHRKIKRFFIWLFVLLVASIVSMLLGYGVMVNI